jgi:gliding motility-associated-like protein
MLFIIEMNNLFSQTELISNGNFEGYTVCPSLPGQIVLVKNWFQPNRIFGSLILGSSSDYYNSCATYGATSVPSNNYSGNQIPNNGNGYIGIAMYTPTGDFNREYIETQLKRKLIFGKNYCVKLYVSLADTSAIGISNIECFFSSDSLIYTSLSYAPISVIPQVSNVSTNIVVDKIRWTLIELKYTATGNEEFLTIGNFSSNASTSSQSVGGVSLDSYYYIDDVSLICCDCEPEVPNIFTPNGDGINDYLEIQNMPDDAIIKIYDRWGIKVFESNKQGNFWDGRTTSGIACNEGVYYYVISTPEDNYRGYLQLVK